MGPLLSSLLKIAAISVLLAGGPAVAGNHEREGRPNPEDRHHRKIAHAVPEFDPAAVGVAAAVLAGGAVLVARRRRR
jgi:hypothetical protein